MHPFRDKRIKWKLTLVILATSAVVLLLAGVALVTFESLSFSDRLVARAETLAEITGENANATLAFRNAADAEMIISRLKGRSEVVFAGLYTSDGKLFVHFTRGKHAGPPTLDPATANGRHFEGRELVFFRPVRFENDVVGAVGLRLDFSEQMARFNAYMLIALLTLAGLLVVAFVLAARLQRLISDPLVQLAQVAERVTSQNDYTVRARKRSNDEIGSLVDAFNQMLQHIAQQDATLRTSEERFRLAFEEGPLGITLVGGDFRYLKVNRAFCAMLGYTEAELLGRAFVEITHTDDLSHDRELADKIFSGGLSRYTMEKRYLKKNGQPLWVNLTASIIRDDAGLPKFGLAIIENIHERKRAEVTRETLLALGQRLSVAKTRVEAARSIFESANALWDWDSGSLQLYSPETDGLQTVLLLDLVDGKRCEVATTRASGQPTPTMRRIMAQGPELILRTPPYAASPDFVRFGNTSRLSASLMLVPIRSRGQAVGVLSVQSYTPNAFTDADLRTLQGLADHCGGALERIRSVEALGESEMRFRQLAESINQVFWMTDPGKSQMIYVSPAYEKIWGRTCASLYQTPRDWINAIHPDDRERVLAAALAKQITGEYDEEYRILRAGGGERWIRDRAFPIRDAAGNVLRIAGIAADITERKRLEREVLEISSAEQRRFGHDLHDGLGQYLTGIALKTKLLEDELRKDGSARTADAEQIVAFVNNAIGQTRSLSRGLDPLHVEAEGLLPALEELAAKTQDLFGVRCTFRGPESSFPLDQFAALQLYHVAREAVNNAMKHAKPSQIQIELTARNGSFTLCVRDDGVGLKAAPQSADGLGLRIMRHRARSMGATFEVRPAPNRGTEICCELSRPSVKPAARGNPPSSL